MIQVSPNVYVESGLNVPSCNLGLVTTREGVVMVDTPIKPSDAVKWRDEVSQKGKLRYVINTEEHPDHCQTSWFFPGTLVTSRETREKLSKTTVAEVRERVKRSDPAGLPLMESYQVRLADIATGGTLNLHLGDHTFSMFPMQGHTTGGIGVYIPQERVVFTTDCVFHQVKTFMQEADPDRWLESLRKVGELDVEVIVPGHGSVCKKDYLKEQADIIRRWVEVVQSAIKQGLSEEEAVAKIVSPDPYPKQANVSFSEADINRMTITHLYRLYSGKQSQ